MTVIIAISVLLLFAYVFDISASSTRIPSVILLLITGWALRQGLDFFYIELPDLTPVLPLLGTVGLILIVLEGSLELELTRSSLPFVAKSFVLAFGPMLLLSFAAAYFFQSLMLVSFKSALLNAIPLAVISSAIAIPSTQSLRPKNRAFIAYESSLSDIFGVIFFNFVLRNNAIDGPALKAFSVEVLIVLGISFFMTLGLSFLLSKIRHHVKFAPIILIIVLIYAIAKIYHLPALLFILLFGLFIGNLENLSKFKIIERMQPEILRKEAQKFKELTIEISFLIRSLFFLLFGYLINTTELLNPNTIIHALQITGAILALRLVFLVVFRLSVIPLMFIAPRGLITILLFLSIPANRAIPVMNNSLVIQVIVLTTLTMMLGTLFKSRDRESDNLNIPDDLKGMGEDAAASENSGPSSVSVEGADSSDAV